jgi:probable F420-dependent oxidoreductase
MQIGINLFRHDSWYGEDPDSVLELVSLADRKGIDSVELGEHVLMGPNAIAQYPYLDPHRRNPLFDERTPFFDPVVELGAFAAVTKRIRLVTSVMLTPLRTPTVLAKQIATLDWMSHGRVDLGVGVGWQRLEYDAEGWPWDHRFGRLTEIAKACKVLWTEAPASFHGRYVNFDNVYSLPFPVQKGGVPQWFGVAASDRNIERMAEIADGWDPLGTPLDTVVSTTQRIKARMRELGRDPAKFSVRLHPEAAYSEGYPDLDATLASIPELLDAGATHISITVVIFCSKADHYEPFLDKFLAAKARYQRG